MIAAVTGRGARACVTVSHLDGLIAGRSGKATSVQYRSVMAFGDPVASTEREAKRHAMNALVDRIYPGRSAELRPALDEELDQITVVSMVIEEASVKAKSEGVIEMQESDYEVPVWAGVIPVRTCVGAIQPDTRLESGIAIGDDIEPYREGARLDDALTQTSASKAG